LFSKRAQFVAKTHYLKNLKKTKLKFAEEKKLVAHLFDLGSAAVGHPSQSLYEVLRTP